jgi:hypothetical protein
MLSLVQVLRLRVTAAALLLSRARGEPYRAAEASDGPS